MFFIAVVVFPVLLLVLLLAMERVERPLRRQQSATDLAHVLDVTAANLTAEETATAARAGRAWRRRPARGPGAGCAFAPVCARTGRDRHGPHVTKGLAGVSPELLAALPLFEQLAAPAREGLAARLSRRAISRGEVVFREGEDGSEVFLVLAGKVKIARTAGDGRENLLAVLGPGEVFGELSLFDPGPRTATAVAVEAGELARLAHSELETWLSERPDAAGVLLRVLARRLRRTNDAMTDLVFTDVPGRVAKALLALAERFGHPLGEGVAVEHGLTQEELAQLVGASRETVNKALADFAGRGWLRLGTRSVVILAPDRLARRAR